MNAVEIVMIPLVWVTDGLEAMILRAAGDTEATLQARKNEQLLATSRLGELLDMGYQNLTSHMVTGSDRECLAIVLYIPPYEREHQSIPLSDRLPF